MQAQIDMQTMIWTAIAFKYLPVHTHTHTRIPRHTHTHTHAAVLLMATAFCHLHPINNCWQIICHLAALDFCEHFSAAVAFWHVPKILSSICLQLSYSLSDCLSSLTVCLSVCPCVYLLALWAGIDFVTAAKNLPVTIVYQGIFVTFNEFANPIAHFSHHICTAPTAPHTLCMCVCVCIAAAVGAWPKLQSVSGV